MDWVDRMNHAIGYVEEHLTNEIDEKEICKIMACSFSMFQGSFTQITGVPLSEYIRRRKLTCAAQTTKHREKSH